MLFNGQFIFVWFACQTFCVLFVVIVRILLDHIFYLCLEKVRFCFWSDSRGMSLFVKSVMFLFETETSCSVLAPWTNPVIFVELLMFTTSATAGHNYHTKNIQT